MPLPLVLALTAATATDPAALAPQSKGGDRKIERKAKVRDVDAADALRARIEKELADDGYTKVEHRRGRTQEANRDDDWSAFPISVGEGKRYRVYALLKPAPGATTMTIDCLVDDGTGASKLSRSYKKLREGYLAGGYSFVGPRSGTGGVLVRGGSGEPVDVWFAQK